jgi:hypothetical protein
MRPFFFYILLLLSVSTFAQVDDGYNDPYNNWDGITHWTRYLTVSPGKFGPNALPVPTLENGLIDSVFTLQGSFIYHYNKGDKTPTIYGAAFIPLGKKVTLEFSGVLVEQFNMSYDIRDERRTFKHRGEGFAKGDLYLKTHVQLLTNHQKWPDISFHTGFKTTTGGRLQEARFTDTHGYQLYVSGGKSFPLTDLQGNVRLYGHLGFFSWQTYHVLHRQDDALMYGAGIEVKLSNYSLKHELTGYHGYRDLGDQPLVYRLEITQFKKQKISFSYQYGIRDFDFHSFAINYFFIKKHE